MAESNKHETASCHENDGELEASMSSYYFAVCAKLDQFNKIVGGAVTRLISEHGGSREAAIELLEWQIQSLRGGTAIPPSYVNLLARRVDDLAARRHGRDTKEHNAFRERLLVEMKGGETIAPSANRETLKKRISDGRNRGSRPKSGADTFDIRELQALDFQLARFRALLASVAVSDPSDVATDASDATSDS